MYDSRKKKSSHTIFSLAAGKLCGADDIWLRDAKLTVEASLLIPLCIMAVGLMLSLSFHVCQRCWYTQSACEVVLTGSSRGVLKEPVSGMTGTDKWEQLKTGFYLKPEKFSASVTENKNQVTMHVQGTTPVWGRDGLQFSGKAEQKIIRPVTFIRKTACLKAK